MLILLFGSFLQTVLVLMLSSIRLRMYEEKGRPFCLANSERVSKRGLLIVRLIFFVPSHGIILVVSVVGLLVF
jgi:hypothetical protein